MEHTRLGRPREFEPSAAVEASMRVFWRVGYAAATVPQLAAAAGVATSSLYNTFGSKQAVYLAALDRYLALTRSHMYGPMLTGSHGAQDIEAFLNRLRSTAGTPPAQGCLITKAIAEFGDTDPAVAARAAEYRSELHEAFSAALGRAQALGELVTDPVQSITSMARALVGLVLSFNLLAGAAAPQPELDALLAAAEDLIRSQSQPQLAQ